MYSQVSLDNQEKKEKLVNLEYQASLDLLDQLDLQDNLEQGVSQGYQDYQVQLEDLSLKKK